MIEAGDGLLVFVGIRICCTGSMHCSSRSVVFVASESRHGKVEKVNRPEKSESGVSSESFQFNLRWVSKTGTFCGGRQFERALSREESDTELQIAGEVNGVVR